MGYIVNHAIIVEGMGGKDEFSVRLRNAHKKAKNIFKGIAEVTSITPQGVNGSSSFMIAPDGSKEGWDSSKKGDDAREKFKRYLKSTSLDWVEVAFGGDYNRADIVDHGDS